MLTFQVLTYHRVAPPGDGVFEGVTPDGFRETLRLVQSFFKIVSLGEAMGRSDPRWGRPRLCVTFDDGYADNERYALPVLQRLGLQATIFVTTGPLETGEPLWHDKMFTIFARTKKTCWSLDGEDFPLDSPAARQTAAERCAHRLRRMDEREREDAIDALGRELGVNPMEAQKRSPMLTWNQLARMAERGVEIGAHTVTHPVLSRLTPQRQREEIFGSIETIQKRLGIRPRFFAYPNGRSGDFNQVTLSLLEEAGICAAFTTVPGVNGPGSDVFRLCRGGPWAPNRFRFLGQLVWQRIRGERCG